MDQATAARELNHCIADLQGRKVQALCPVGREGAKGGPWGQRRWIQQAHWGHMVEAGRGAGSSGSRTVALPHKCWPTSICGHVSGWGLAAWPVHRQPRCPHSSLLWRRFPSSPACGRGPLPPPWQTSVHQLPSLLQPRCMLLSNLASPWNTSAQMPLRHQNFSAHARVVDPCLASSYRMPLCYRLCYIWPPYVV
jgi:hypothetical protein